MAPKGPKQAPAKPAAKAEKKSDPLFQAAPRNFRVGGDIRPKSNLSRFVKWPRYVRLQRQKKILQQRLKVPPALNQFASTLDKNQASELFKLLMKYQPEDATAKTERLKGAAEEAAAGAAPAATKAPTVVKFGLKHVTYLVETKKAKLVCIASDVDPIELVVWLPALCKKMDVPYCIVKNKARLGWVAHQKTAAVCCLTHVKKEDQHSLDALRSNFKTQFNDNVTAVRKWGGGIMGLKTQAKLLKREKLLAAELAKKAQY
ncbi:50S ribosomal protein L30e-like protein [Pelagophyceae sp. CCMP2097]|nr:50S ribosomal protein L30e-like protein [Pelagophyceae sp. CCMP2097]